MFEDKIQILLICCFAEIKFRKYTFSIYLWKNQKSEKFIFKNGRRCFQRNRKNYNKNQ